MPATRAPSSRHLPAELLSTPFTWAFVAVSAVVFFLAAAELNQLCLRLAPVALAIVFFYSFTKRFTSFSHLVLGFSLGIAPAAAWIAIRGSLDPRILWLTAAVDFLDGRLRRHLLLPGFRVRYRRSALQHPQTRSGIAGALHVAQMLHVAMIACLWALAESLHLGFFAWIGIGAVSAVLIYEHSLVKPNDLSRVNAAFFTMNGYVSVLFFVFWAADIFLLKPGV